MTDSETNPEIEACLDALAKLVCSKLSGEPNDFQDRFPNLLRTLLMSGYQRPGQKTLMVDVEERVKAQSSKPSIHRGGALSSITSQLGQEFQLLARMKSCRPD